MNANRRSVVMRTPLPLILLLIGACAATQTPRIDVAAPERAAMERPPAPQVPRSNVPLDVRVDLRPVVALARAMVKNPIVNTNEVHRIVNQRFLKVEARVETMANLRDARVSMRDNQLTLTAVIDLRLRLTPKVRGFAGRFRVGAGSTSCGYGEPMSRVEVSVIGKIYAVTGPALRFERTGWKTRWLRHCRITAFNVSLDRILNLPLIQGRVKKAVDDALAQAPSRLDLQGRLAHIWSFASDATSMGPSAFVRLEPEALVLNDIRGRGAVAVAHVTVRARPRIVIGESPGRSNRPMGRVRVGRAKPSAVVRFESLLPYAAVTAAMGSAKGGGADGVVIEKLRAFGASTRLAVAVTLSEPVAGTVYVIGTPRYEPERGRVVVDALRFTDASRAALARRLDPQAIASMEARLTRAAVFELPRAARDALSRLRAGWGGKRSNVRVRLPTLRAPRVDVLHRGLSVGAILSGSMRLRL